MGEALQEPRQDVGADGGGRPQCQRAVLHVAHADQGVAAGRHGRGAGVVGFTLDLYFEDSPPGDPGDHADGRARPVEIGALFDVQFEVGGQFAGFTDGLFYA